MKASRLLSILMLLQSRGRMTAAALAEALEVSERTILRDVDHLSAAGVPLWGERGRAGGFQLRAGWTTQLTGLTEQESRALLLAGLPSAATELGLGRAAVSARLKMVASLPSPWREQADRVAERLHVDPVDWYRDRDAPACLREIADAVWNARRITVRYRSWRSASRRELEPLGLVLKAGAWYLVAREAGHDGPRHFRVAGVQDVIAIGSSFRRPRHFDLARYWHEATARFEAELRPLQARLRVSPRAMTWLLNDLRPHVAVAVGAAVPGGRDGWHEVLLPVESIEHGARQMLALGAEAEVLAPPELREQVVRLIADVQRRYAAPPASRRRVERMGNR